MHNGTITSSLLPKTFVSPTQPQPRLQHLAPLRTYLPVSPLFLKGSHDRYTDLPHFRWILSPQLVHFDPYGTDNEVSHCTDLLHLTINYLFVYQSIYLSIYLSPLLHYYFSKSPSLFVLLPPLLNPIPPPTHVHKPTYPYPHLDLVVCCGCMSRSTGLQC